MLLALFACADTPPPEVHKLLDLFRPQMQLNTGSAPGGTEQIQLFVHPLTPGPCHPIPTLKATLDGKPMTRLHGKVEGEVPYDRDCAVFEFTIDPKEIVAGPSNVVVVTDGESTFTLEVASLFAPRTVTPSATEVRAGDSVTLAWSPPTDVVAAKGEVAVELVSGGKPTVIKRKDLVFGPGTITFTVPEGVTGETKLSVLGTTQVQPAITRCEGANACKVSRAYDVAPVVLKGK